MSKLIEVVKKKNKAGVSVKPFQVWTLNSSMIIEIFHNISYILDYSLNAHIPHDEMMMMMMK